MPEKYKEKIAKNIPLGISSTELRTLGPGKWCILTPWLNKGYLPNVNAYNFIEDLGASIR